MSCLSEGAVQFFLWRALLGLSLLSGRFLWRPESHHIVAPE
ncbi:plasmid and phage DNA primase domain protein [Yersinia pestis PY-89]|nr:plasmid and phage DNA primase domain protein [Yersinia pestis PY-89]